MMMMVVLVERKKRLDNRKKKIQKMDIHISFGRNSFIKIKIKILKSTSLYIRIHFFGGRKSETHPFKILMHFYSKKKKNGRCIESWENSKLQLRESRNGWLE